MRRVAWILLLGFSFSIPWEYSLDVGAPLGNIARICGVLLVLAAIPAVLQAGRMRMPGAMQWLVLGLFLWFCCSFFWSIDRSATLERLRAYAQVMMTVWVVWELTEGPEDLRDLVRACVAGSWVLAALTIANFAAPATADQVRFAAEGQDPNDVARFLDLGFPLAALLWRAEQRWWGKILVLGYLPLGLLAVLLTASRAGFLAASIAIVGCGFLLLRGRTRIVPRELLALSALTLIFLFAVPRATIARIATIPEQLMSGDLNHRVNIWAAGWRAFAHAPLFGSGAGSFVAAARLAQFDTAHNTALAIAVEGGLVALVLAMGILVTAGLCVLHSQGPARLALGTALVVWIVSSLAATLEENRSTWFLLALIAATARYATETSFLVSSPRKAGSYPAKQMRIAEPRA